MLGIIGGQVIEEGKEGKEEKEKMEGEKILEKASPLAHPFLQTGSGRKAPPSRASIPNVS